MEKQLVVETTATVNYKCCLTEADTKKVLERAEKIYRAHEDYYDEVSECYREAVERLFCEGKINLYKHSAETDFSTERIDSASFED